MECTLLSVTAELFLLAWAGLRGPCRAQTACLSLLTGCRVVQGMEAALKEATSTCCWYFLFLFCTYLSNSPMMFIYLLHLLFWSMNGWGRTTQWSHSVIKQLKIKIIRLGNHLPCSLVQKIKVQPECLPTFWSFLVHYRCLALHLPTYSS